jgi:hypothetical protein
MADRRSAYRARHGTKEHELDVVLCLLAPRPEGYEYDSTQSGDPELELIRITPTPRVVSKPLRTITEGQNGAVSITVDRYEVSDVSRLNYTKELLKSPLYFLVVPRGAEVDPTKVPLDETVKYQLKEEVAMFEATWKFMLEEMK